MIRRRHLRMAARYAAHRFRALHPFEVQAVLLNACNLKCAYCKCPEVKTRLLTTEQWLDIIRRLAALGTLRLKFQGGEPTVRSDFRQLCAASREAGIVTAVVTNGVRIPDHPELLDYLDEIVFSLDSPTPEHNDRVRGAGTHARVVRAIELAQARRLPAYINMVVTQGNIDQLEAMLEFCEARGVRLNAQPAVFGHVYYDERAQPSALSNDAIRTMFGRLVEWKRQGRGLMFSAAIYARSERWPDYSRLTQRSEGESTCIAGKSYIHIEANGDVHPCTQHNASVKPKNIIADGLEAALLNLQRHDCGDCFAAYLNERKALFALRPVALAEMARRG